MSCSISRLTSTLASFVHPCCIYLHIIHAFGKACCPECALEHEVRYLLRSQPPKKNMNALCWNTVVLKYCWMLGCKDAVAFSSFRWNRQKTLGCQRNLTFGTNGLKARCGFPKVKKHYAYIYIYNCHVQSFCIEYICFQCVGVCHLQMPICTSVAGSCLILWGRYNAETPQGSGLLTMGRHGCNTIHSWYPLVNGLT